MSDDTTSHRERALTALSAAEQNLFPPGQDPQADVAQAQATMALTHAVLAVEEVLRSAPNA
jgi:hypothetical protein